MQQSLKDRVARNLKLQLDLLATDKPAVKIKGEKVVHARPVLVAEVEFRAWTIDAQLRHASFKGIREIADSSTVYEIKN